MDKIVSLCKRRGFIFPASEIYGGIANTYDYGHYGVLLKTTSSTRGGRPWSRSATTWSALDSAIIQNPRTWEASGHVAGFTDPLVDCQACQQRFRADQLEEGSGTAATPRSARHAPSKLPGRARTAS